MKNKQTHLSKGKPAPVTSKRFHIAIAVTDIAESIEDYSKRLGSRPQIVIDNEYALWKTETLNFSISKTSEPIGVVRHIGWEDNEASSFTIELDCNGLKWERFNEQSQLDEIRGIWPSIKLDV